MSCRSEGKAKQEGRLPGYAPDLTRYCTTCRTEIRNQVVKKSKCCPNFHPVDLRNEWSEDWGRCTMCDNYINGKFIDFYLHNPYEFELGNISFMMGMRL